MDLVPKLLLYLRLFHWGFRFFQFHVTHQGSQRPSNSDVSCNSINSIDLPKAACCSDNDQSTEGGLALLSNSDHFPLMLRVAQQVSPDESQQNGHPFITMFCIRVNFINHSQKTVLIWFVLYFLFTSWRPMVSERYILPTFPTISNLQCLHHHTLNPVSNLFKRKEIDQLTE
jgi:hypothetical protein